MSGAATLLFAHGNGFCKEIWNPIVRRLEAAPLLRQRAGAVQCVPFDLPYHGSRRDASAPAGEIHLEDPAAPRVTHVGNNWIQWSSAAVRDKVKQLRAAEAGAARKTPLIGIGHSMGAVALWNTEVAHPGTFDGLVLFEPVYRLHMGETVPQLNFLTTITLQRESQWPTREAAVAHFESLRNFASWDREALRDYISGAVVHDAGTDTFVLAYHPHIEASVYCSSTLDLSDAELAQPQCRTVFQSGERSKLFKRDIFTGLSERLPHIYSVESPMRGTGHLMVMEDPEESTKRILASLAQLAPFCDQEEHEQAEAQCAGTSASRL